MAWAMTRDSGLSSDRSTLAFRRKRAPIGGWVDGSVLPGWWCGSAVSGAGVAAAGGEGAGGARVRWGVGGVGGWGGWGGVAEGGGGAAGATVRYEVWVGGVLVGHLCQGIAGT